MTIDKLNSLLESNHVCKLIDVREQYEFEDGNIPNSINIPMGEIKDSVNDIRNLDIYYGVGTDYVIFYCQTGRRSAAVNCMVKEEFKKHNTYSLEGGYEEYINNKIN